MDEKVSEMTISSVELTTVVAAMIALVIFAVPFANAAVVITNHKVVWYEMILICIGGEVIGVTLIAQTEKVRQIIHLAAWAYIIGTLGMAAFEVDPEFRTT